MRIAHLQGGGSDLGTGGFLPWLPSRAPVPRLCDEPRSVFGHAGGKWYVSCHCSEGLTVWQSGSLADWRKSPCCVQGSAGGRKESEEAGREGRWGRAGLQDGSFGTFGGGLELSTEYPWGSIGSQRFLTQVYTPRSLPSW